MSFRYGTSWRTGPGRRAWVSGPLWAWLLLWMLVWPLVLIWLAVKLIAAIVHVIAWLIRRAHQAPAVPPALRTPPGRRP